MTSLRKILLMLIAGIFYFCTPQISFSMDQQQAVTQDSFRQHAPEAGPAPKIETGTYHTETLDNGMKVIVVENHKLPRISFQLFIDRLPQSQNDKAGVYELTGNLLGSGTSNKTKDEIDEAVDYIGARTSYNSYGGYGQCLSQHAETLIGLMSDVICNASLPQEEFEKVKKQKLSGLAAEANNPNAIAANIRKRVNFGDHPYGEFATEESIENITLEDCERFYHTSFNPSKAFFVVVGDIEATQAFSLAEKYFGTWESPEDGFYSPEPIPAKPEERTVAFVDRPAAVQSVIHITHPVEIDKKSDDYFAAMVANEVLGGGVFSGYLMQNLREDKGYTYGARSTLKDDREIGYFNAFASVRNEVTDSAVVEFLREMNRIREEKVDPQLLSLVKNSMSGSFSRSLERPETIAQQALNIARYNLPETFYQEYLQEIEKVDQQEVMKAAKKYIDPIHCNILVVGNKDEVAHNLTRFDGDKEITFFTEDGSVIDMAAQELPEGLTASDVLSNYFKTIGGKDRLNQIKRLQWNIEMSIMGMTMNGSRYVSFPDKYADISNMQGMTVNKYIYNDGAGIMMNPQQGTTEMPEEELHGAKLNAHIFKELHYEKLGYTVELTGMEMIEGNKAYKLKVTPPHKGDPTIEYYDVESGLKLREVSQTQGPQGKVPVIMDYQEYKEIDGIKFPWIMQLSGPMPEPMKMNTTEVKVNPELPEDIFTLDTK